MTERILKHAKIQCVLCYVTIKAYEYEVSVYAATGILCGLAGGTLDRAKNHLYDHHGFTQHQSRRKLCRFFRLYP